MRKFTLQQKIDKLHALLASDPNISYKVPVNLVYDIYENEIDGHNHLYSVLQERCARSGVIINFIDGIIFDLLLNSDSLSIVDKIKEKYPYGIVPLRSEIDIDYSSLQKLLLEKQFQKADELTQNKLCELSQAINNHSRSWLYFTDISSLPSVDLYIIDQLWKVYSKGLFGLSVQRSIWLANNTNWDKFWSKIGWKIDNISCRYPQEFIWDVNAPAGHLPLFNQLRGVQVLAALFHHPVWVESMSD